MSKPTFHASVLRTVTENAYNVDDTTLEDLVVKTTKADAVGNVLKDNYFGILVTRSKRELGAAPVTVESQLAAIDKANKPMLVIVNRGVTTPDVAPNKSDDDATRDRKTKERNRRGIFARSAATTLRNWVKAGGNLATLEEGEYKKSRFEAEAKEAKAAADEAAGENTPEAKVTKRLASLITALNQLEDVTRAGYAKYCIDAIKDGVA